MVMGSFVLGFRINPMRGEKFRANSHRIEEKGWLATPIDQRRKGGILINIDGPIGKEN